jgi:ribosomal protein S21
MVEVTNDDLERAIRKMKRRLKDDNGIKLLRERQYFRKPSELKVLARKERDKRIAKKTFRAKLKWITARQARYNMALSIELCPFIRVSRCSHRTYFCVLICFLTYQKSTKYAYYSHNLRLLM